MNALGPLFVLEAEGSQERAGRGTEYTDDAPTWLFAGILAQTRRDEPTSGPH
jgi:hypothetical protein